MVETVMEQIARLDDFTKLQNLHKNALAHAGLSDEDKVQITSAAEEKMRVVSPVKASRALGPKDGVKPAARKAAKKAPKAGPDETLTED